MLGKIKQAHNGVVAFGNAVSAYTVVLGIVAAVIAAIVAAIVKLGQPFAGTEPWNWAEATLIGLVAGSAFALVTAITVLTLVMAWRRFRPAPSDAGDVASSLVDAGAGQTVADEVAAMVTRLQEAISDRTGELVALQRHVEMLDAREQRLLEGDADRYRLLGEYKDRIESIERALVDDRALAEERRTAMQTAIDGLTNDHAHTRRMARAMAHKARMDERGGVIIKGATMLMLADGGEAAAADWPGWEIEFEDWKSDLSAWIEWAREYSSDANDQLFNLSADEIGPDRGWLIQDKDFPSAKNCHDYRRFLVLFKKWREVEKKAQASLFKILFS